MKSHRLEEPTRTRLVSLRLHGVLADDVERVQLVMLDGVEHLAQVQATRWRDRDPPGGIEGRPERIILDVLEARQSVGQGSHVSAALDIVLAAQRIEAAAVAAHMAGEQRQRDERQDIVDGVVVLGDAQRPAQDGSFGRGVAVGQLADGFRGHTGLPFGPVQRACLDTLAIGLEAAGGPLDEGIIGQTGGDDLPSDRVGQGDVRADVDPKPQVGPFGRTGATRVDGDDASPVAHPAQQVMEEDRMGLPGVAAPQEHEIGLFDLTI